MSTAPNNILELTDPKELLQIDSILPEHTLFTPEEITHLFRLAGALWQYEPGSGKPHAVLTSGLHSDGFIDTLELLTYTPVCDKLARQLVHHIRQVYDGPIDWVIGSDHAGADFSQSVARVLKSRHAFTEKEKGADGEVQTWKRHTIEEGEVVLQVEELITTMTTLSRVRAGIKLGNTYPVMYAPIVGIAVNRSPHTAFEGSPIVQLVNYRFTTYEPDTCALCKEGSEAIVKPKLNWKRLTGEA